MITNTVNTSDFKFIHCGCQTGKCKKVDVLAMMLSCLVLTTACCNNRDINEAEVLIYGGPDISDSDNDIN